MSEPLVRQRRRRPLVPLSPRQKTIVAEYFAGRTALAVLARKHGYTRQRIQQLVARFRAETGLDSLTGYVIYPCSTDGCKRLVAAKRIDPPARCYVCINQMLFDQGTKGETE